MGNYIKNLETGKIELHFEKSDYMALTEAQKSELKSAYLWSNFGKCWVSRAKEPNTYRAERVAKALGFDGCEKVGERLSYAEQLDRKAEKAELRAERYEGYAGNAEKRGVALQADLNSMRGDIAFFTQPIIAGHSGSQAFARCRERMYAKYDRGFEEFKKGEYYLDRAATARTTANMKQLENRIYLDNRIKECNKSLKHLQESIIAVENNIYKLQQGEKLKAWNSEPVTIEGQESRLEDILDRYEVVQDKLNFFEDCMSKLGGVQFSKDNIHKGYIVEIKHSGRCMVVGNGAVNVTYQILEGGAKNMVLTASYASIEKILEVKEEAPIVNPYSVGDILYTTYMASSAIRDAFQVVKTTDKNVMIQEIEIVEGIPQPNQFKLGSEPSRKKVAKSPYSDWVGAYCGNWQLYKYTA